MNQAVNELHCSYNTARQLQVPMQMAHERHWWNASQAGVTPEMVADVIAYRQKRILAGVRHPESLMIKNLCGDEERIADFIEEAFMLAAKKRVRVLDYARAEILRATGRSDQPPETTAQPVREVLRKAIQ